MCRATILNKSSRKERLEEVKNNIETNVKVYTLDQIVTEESKNSSYIDIMNKNLETLKEAFK